MKAKPWVLPLIAALAVGGWIASRRSTAAALEHEITVLQERMRQARSIGNGGSSYEAGEKAKDRRLNWKEVAASFSANVHEGPQDIRTMMRLRRLLMDLSAEELCGQLDELAATDMDERVRRQLEGMIFGALVEKDPKLALLRFESRIGDEGLNWQLASALQKWASKDLSGAMAWMDRQIAAGVFQSKSLDGENGSYMRFESSLVGVLLKSDVQSAIKRVMTIPEEQRDEFFSQGIFMNTEKGREDDFVRLVRGTVQSSDVGGVLARHAAGLVRGQDFERVDEFISVSQATPDEKAAMVSLVMQRSVTSGGKVPLDTEVIDKVRDWAAAHDPGTVDRNTGEMLANSLWVVGGDIEKVGAIALKYQASSGNDDTLTAFLTNERVRGRGGEDKRRVLDLAASIKDPAKRREVIELIEGKEGRP